MELFQLFTLDAALLLNTSGTIVMSNARCQELLGYRSDELLGMNVTSVAPIGFSFIRQEIIDKMPGMGISEEIELTIFTKGGSSFGGKIKGMAMETSYGPYLALFLRDDAPKGLKDERPKNTLVIAAYRESEHDSMHPDAIGLKSAVAQRPSVSEYDNVSVQSLIDKIQYYQANEKNFIKIQRLYDAIVRHYPDGVIGVLNTQLEYVLLVGSELTAIDLPALGLVGHTGGRPLPSALAEETLSKVRKAFSGRRVSFELTADDRVYHVLAVPLPDDQNQIHEILCVLKNITDRKRLETGLLKALNKEKELGEFKSRFVNMACHEFKTPLATILSSIFLLEQYSGEVYETEKTVHTSRIKRSVKNLTQILNEFLNLERLDENRVALVYASIHLPGLVREIIKDLDSSQLKERTIEYTHEGPDEIVYLDQVLLGSSIRNLLTNALKYSRNATVVSINSEIKNKELIFRVRDIGIGIPPQEQEHIFQRFYRAGNSINFDGTGLGLHIVAKNAALLKGKISFVSELEKGTEFTLTLPAGDLSLVESSIFTN
jgi:PAS domain S-box-containing protein